MFGCLGSLNPTVVVFDCHPTLPPKIVTTPRFTSKRRKWPRAIESSSYGETQSRSRAILASSRLNKTASGNMDPLYILDVKLPAVISEFVRKSDEVIQGKFLVCPRNSVDINQPTPMGWISLIPECATFGAKTDRGVIEKLEERTAYISTVTGTSRMDIKTLNILLTKYQVYSQEGLTFPMGKPYPPSGFGHAIIFDINNNRVRPLSLLECWLITGGEESLFYEIGKEYAQHVLLTAATPAFQLFLVQLALGLLGSSSVDENRAGG